MSLVPRPKIDRSGFSSRATENSLRKNGPLLAWSVYQDDDAMIR